MLEKRQFNQERQMADGRRQKADCSLPSCYNLIEQGFKSLNKNLVAPTQEDSYLLLSISLLLSASCLLPSVSDCLSPVESIINGV